MIGHGQRDADEHETGEDHERRDDHHRLLDPLLFQILLLRRRQRQRLPRGPEVTRSAGGSGERLRVDENARRPYDARRRGADLGRGRPGRFKVVGSRSFVALTSVRPMSIMRLVAHIPVDVIVVDVARISMPSSW